MSAPENIADKSERPYAVIVHVGPAPAADNGVRLADLSVQEDPRLQLAGESHPVLVQLAASGLTPADMRAKVLFNVGAGVRPADAVAAYATLIAFAGRRVDVSCDGHILDLPELDARTREVADGGRLDATLEVIQVGAEHPEMPSVGADGRMGPPEVAQVRYARRVRMVPVAQAVAALAQFVVVAALRARRDQDRFPLLVNGDEPAWVDGELVSAGVDLDEMRRAAVEARRGLRAEDRSSLAPVVELTVRQAHMCAAADLPIEATMIALGATTADGTLWHCPRPERHTNGDAIPSMRLERGKGRCFRCDPERGDSLRLAADTLELTFDEAAIWLEANVAGELDALLAQVPVVVEVEPEATGGIDAPVAAVVVESAVTASAAVDSAA